MALFGLTDTDLVIDALRARPGVRDALSALLALEPIAVSTVSVYELETGLGPGQADQRQRVERLLGAMTVLPLDPAAARAAGAVARELGSAGLPIGTADILIAGIALANGLPLLTRNTRHFGRVRGLRVFTF